MTQAQCAIFGGDSVAASTVFTVILAGMKNPAAGKYQLTVDTTSDVLLVSSQSYSIVPPPTITKVKPSTGPVGQNVAIIGTNLEGATKVSFNGVPATITSDAATKIVTSVPAGATTGKITVTAPDGTATSPKSFTVT